MKTVRLAVNNVVENIHSRCGEAEAEKTTDRLADSRQIGKFLSKKQSCEHKYVLDPVMWTHYLQEFHTWCPIYVHAA